MREVLRAVAVCAALLLVASCGSSAPGQQPVSQVQVNDDDGLNGAVMPHPYDAPSIPLTTTEGATYRLSQDADDPLTLVFFGYTHCPDVCQIVMADIASAMTRLDEAERAQVGMEFVTTDPARDDEKTLRQYLDRYNPEFGGLTGPLRRIVAAGKALGVSIEKGERLPSGGYEVAHGAQVIGVLPDGTAPVIWTQSSGPEMIADDIRTILRQGGVPTGGDQ